MKNKRAKSIVIILTAMLMMSVFTIPALASDNDDETDLDDILIPIPIVVTHERNQRSLTPPGNLSLVDDATVTTIEDKQFMTVTTKNGNVFYIVVDRDGNNENVYFLNLVDELDLIALLEDDFEMPEKPTPEPYVPVQVQPAEPEPVPEPEKSNNSGIITLIVFLALGGIGAGVYFKVIKPKQAMNTTPFMPEDELISDDYDNDYSNNDEPDEEDSKDEDTENEETIDPTPTELTNDEDEPDAEEEHNEYI